VQFKKQWTKLNQMNQDLLSKQISNGKIREKEEKNEQIKEQQRIRNEENMEKSQEI